MKKITWIIDYYLVYLLYNPKKINRYHKLMIKKYGDKYLNRTGKI